MIAEEVQASVHRLVYYQNWGIDFVLYLGTLYVPRHTFGTRK